jgi:hypothetical protein
MCRENIAAQGVQRIVARVAKVRQAKEIFDAA